MRRRVDGERIKRCRLSSVDRIKLVESLDLVAPERDAIRGVSVSGKHLNGVASHAKLPAEEVNVVTLILHGGELAQNLAPFDGLAHLQREHGLLVVVRRADAKYARNACNDNGVTPRQQRLGSRMPEPVNLVVNGRFLCHVDVGVRDVGLRAIIIVVAHEVLNRVLREELPELLIELCG